MQNTLNPSELRKEPRYNINVLPESYKTFIITLNDVGEIEADLVDASLTGLGLLVPCTLDHFVQGTNIAIMPASLQVHLYGKVVFTQRISPEYCRLGISLRETPALETYQAALKNHVPA